MLSLPKKYILRMEGKLYLDIHLFEDGGNMHEMVWFFPGMVEPSLFPI
jgi:hypothetical protein